MVSIISPSLLLSKVLDSFSVLKQSLVGNKTASDNPREEGDAHRQPSCSWLTILALSRVAMPTKDMAPSFGTKDSKTSTRSKSLDTRLGSGRSSGGGRAADYRLPSPSPKGALSSHQEPDHFSKIIPSIFNVPHPQYAHADSLPHIGSLSPSQGTGDHAPYYKPRYSAQHIGLPTQLPQDQALQDQIQQLLEDADAPIILPGTAPASFTTTGVGSVPAASGKTATVQFQVQQPPLQGTIKQPPLINTKIPALDLSNLKIFANSSIPDSPSLKIFPKDAAPGTQLQQSAKRIKTTPATIDKVQFSTPALKGLTVDFKPIEGTVLLPQTSTLQPAAKQAQNTKILELNLSTLKLFMDKTKPESAELKKIDIPGIQLLQGASKHIAATAQQLQQPLEPIGIVQNLKDSLLVQGKKLSNAFNALTSAILSAELPLPKVTTLGTQIQQSAELIGPTLAAVGKVPSASVLKPLTVGAQPIAKAVEPDLKQRRGIKDLAKPKAMAQKDSPFLFHPRQPNVLADLKVISSGPFNEFAHPISRNLKVPPLTVVMSEPIDLIEKLKVELHEVAVYTDEAINLLLPQRVQNLKHPPLEIEEGSTLTTKTINLVDKLRVDLNVYPEIVTTLALNKKPNPAYNWIDDLTNEFNEQIVYPDIVEAIEIPELIISLPLRAAPNLKELWENRDMLSEDLFAYQSGPFVLELAGEKKPVRKPLIQFSTTDTFQTHSSSLTSKPPASSLTTNLSEGAKNVAGALHELFRDMLPTPPSSTKALTKKNKINKTLPIGRAIKVKEKNSYASLEEFAVRASAKQKAAYDALNTEYQNAFNTKNFADMASIVQDVQKFGDNVAFDMLNVNHLLALDGNREGVKESFREQYLNAGTEEFANRILGQYRFTFGDTAADNLMNEYNARIALHNLPTMSGDELATLMGQYLSNVKTPGKFTDDQLREFLTIRLNAVIRTTTPIFPSAPVVPADIPASSLTIPSPTGTFDINSIDIDIVKQLIIAEYGPNTIDSGTSEETIRWFVSKVPELEAKIKDLNPSTTIVTSPSVSQQVTDEATQLRQRLGAVNSDYLDTDVYDDQEILIEAHKQGISLATSTPLSGDELSADLGLAIPSAPIVPVDPVDEMTALRQALSEATDDDSFLNPSTVNNNDVLTFAEFYRVPIPSTLVSATQPTGSTTVATQPPVDDWDSFIANQIGGPSTPVVPTTPTFNTLQDVETWAKVNVQNFDKVYGFNGALTSYAAKFDDYYDPGTYINQEKSEADKELIRGSLKNLENLVGAPIALEVLNKYLFGESFSKLSSQQQEEYLLRHKPNIWKFYGEVLNKDTSPQMTQTLVAQVDKIFGDGEGNALLQARLKEPVVSTQPIVSFEDIKKALLQSRMTNIKALNKFEKKLTADEKEEVKIHLNALYNAISNDEVKGIIGLIKEDLKDSRGDALADLLSRQFVDLNGTYVEHGSGKKFFVYDTDENNGAIAGSPLAGSHTKRILEIGNDTLAGNPLKPGDKVTVGVTLHPKKSHKDEIREIATAPVPAPVGSVSSTVSV